MSKVINIDNFWVDLDKVRYIIEHPHTYEFVYDGGENQDTIYFSKNHVNVFEVINQMNIDI
jgi:hypothetical protein